MSKHNRRYKSGQIKGLRRICICLAVGFLLCAASIPAETDPLREDSLASVRIGALSGPTAMGLVKLMEDAEQGNTLNHYEFADLMTEAAAFTAPLTNGELDIAAVPANLAAVLYNKTGGGVRTLAVCVRSVLQIVSRGDGIRAVTDLKGTVLYATGQGATPEYVLRYLLAENGLDPEADVDIRWCADTTEALARIQNDPDAAAMLPQPFATAACAKTEGLHTVLDLGEEWDRLENGCSVVTGVMVVRTAFAEEHPDLVENFLDEYQASVEYAQEDTAGAAALIEKYGIVGSAAIAEKALPECGIVCLTGKEMEDALSGYLQVLYDQDPASVGGVMPSGDFYLSD